MTVQVERHLFTVDEYHRMSEAGIFGEDDRVELIEGEIVDMSPISSRHAACVKRLNREMSQRLGDRAIISVQDPIQLDERSEPQPDLAVLKPREDFYASKHPTAEDVLLVVEVAETSLAYDRTVKVNLYGRKGIGEVWLIDLVSEAVELYADPANGEFRVRERFGRGDVIASRAIAGLEISVSAILG